MQDQSLNKNITLVLGGTGKTGRRVAERLKVKGHAVRIGSRSAHPPFDWDNERNWEASLKDVTAVYITYVPDLAMPGATDAIQAFVNQAKRQGIKRLVLLSGRREPEAQACERIVQEAELEWTVIRAAWFSQNFSEGAFVDMVLDGTIALPGGDTPEPYIDADDIADVAVAALTEAGHSGQIYEVTGPRLMTMADVAADLSRATGREINHINIPHEAFISEIANSGAPKDVVWILDYLFSTILDGRNAHLTEGVERALGRPPKDFADYAQEVAASGTWRSAA